MARLDVTLQNIRIGRLGAGEDGTDNDAEWHLDFLIEVGNGVLDRERFSFDDRSVFGGNIFAINRTFSFDNFDPLENAVTLQSSGFEEDELAPDDTLPLTLTTVEAVDQPLGSLVVEASGLSPDREFSYRLDWLLTVPQPQLVLGTEDANDLAGTDADDIIRGFGGGDRLSGGDGDDELHGGGGDDDLFGDAGDDVLHGEQGIDGLTGGRGDDRLFGGAGDDDGFRFAGAGLNVGNGDDELDGGAGGDSLLGGNDDDELDGSAGNDFLRGGSGDDVLRGGSGIDHFQFFSNPGHDTILDFQPNVDKIAVRNSAAFSVVATDPTGETVIRIFPAGARPGDPGRPGPGDPEPPIGAEGELVTVIGLDPSQFLSTDDFIII